MSTGRPPAGIPTRERAGGRRSVTISPGKALICTLLLSACGVNRQPLAGPGVEMSIRNVHQCVAESTAAGLPPVETVVDVERLGSRIADLLESSERSGGQVLLTLWYDAQGMNIRRDLLRHELEPAVADSVQKLVFASLRPMPAARSEWGARLRIRAGEEVNMELEPREYCPPRPRSPGLEAAMAEFMTTGTRYRGGRRERSVLVGVTVHPLGYVRGARIIRGGTPGSSLERELSEYVRQFFFHPASLDGVPVHGEIAVPVRLRG
jgi:hypothetical protein